MEIRGSRFDPQWDDYDIEVEDEPIDDRPEIPEPAIITPEDIHASVVTELALVIRGQLQIDGGTEQDLLSVVRSLGPLSIAEAMAAAPRRSMAVPGVFGALEAAGVIVRDPSGPPIRFRAAG